MRPASIVWFERFYLGSLAMGLLSTAINWSSLMAATQAAPGASGFIGSSTFMLLIMAFSFAISACFWYLIARRGSKVAKWIVTVLFAVGLLSLPGTLSNPLFGPLIITFAVINLLFQLAAVVCLFRPDTVDWFNGKRPADPDVFN